MPEERLRRTLSELREELARTDTADPDARERLQATAEEIEAWLERSGAGPESLADRIEDRLGEAMAQFRAEHPNLTAAVRRVVDALTDLGI